MPFGFRLTDIFKLDLFLHQWWAWQELNLRPHAYQACALTTELQALNQHSDVNSIKFLKEKADECEPFNIDFNFLIHLRSTRITVNILKFNNQTSSDLL